MTEKKSNNDDKENDSRKKQNEGLGNIWKNFASTTTAHGFSHLTVSTNTTIRVLWISVIVACQVFLYLQIHPLVVNYLQKPTKTKLYLREEHSQVFPVVTVCNTNPIKASKVDDLKKYSEFKDGNYFETSPQQQNGSSDDGGVGDNIDSGRNLKRQRKSLSRKNEAESRRNINYFGTSSRGKSSKQQNGKDEDGEKSKRKISSPGDNISRTSDGGRSHSRGGRGKRAIKSQPSSSSSSTKRKIEWKAPVTPPDSGERDFDDPPEATLNEYASKMEIFSRMGNIAQEYGDEVFHFGFNLDEMIKECEWKDYYDCTPSKWWTPVWHYRYGNCYAFNMLDTTTTSSAKNESSSGKNLLKVTGAGPDQGLKLELRLNQDEYLDGYLLDTAGIVMHIGEQGGRVEPHLNRYSLAPNFEHNIALSKTKIVRADPFKNGSCRAHTEMNMGNRSFSNQFISKYSVHACREMCLAKTQIENCGCSSYWLPSLNSNRTCGQDDMECADNYWEMSINGQLPCLKLCRQPCHETKYEIQSSFRSYPIKKRKPTSQTLKEKDQDEILKVLVYFKTLETQVIEDQEYYFMENLLGDIGGQLGLFSGVSALTVVELIFFLSNALIAVGVSLKWICFPSFKNTVQELDLGSNCQS